jgi:uncharacterized membrane protein
MLPMTAPAAPVTARSVLGAPFAIRVGLTMVIALAIVAAAIGPRRAALGLAHLPPLHPHAPDLALIARAPIQIQLHLFAVLLAFAIGVALLAGVKGRTMHRTLGWVWVVAMMTGAVSSLFIRIINHGSLSYIHLLAGWTIVALPMAVFAARTHRVRAHARFMTGLFTGGLILAGLLAFLPGRLMWTIFLG